MNRRTLLTAMNRGGGIQFPTGLSVSVPAAWDVWNSQIRTGRDGSGSAPANAGVVGHITNHRPANPTWVLTCNDDAARPTLFSSFMQYGFPAVYFDSASAKRLYCRPCCTLFTGTAPSWGVMSVYASLRQTGTLNRWGLQKNGGSLAASAGNPAIYYSSQSGATTAGRPRFNLSRGHDASTSLSTDLATAGQEFAGAGINIELLTFNGSTRRQIWQNGQLALDVAGASNTYTFTDEDYFCINGCFDGTTQDLNGGLQFWFATALLAGYPSANDMHLLNAFYSQLVGLRYSSSPGTIYPTIGLGDSHTEGKRNEAMDPTPSGNPVNNVPSWLQQAQRLLPYERSARFTNYGTYAARFDNAGASDQEDVYDAQKANIDTGSLIASCLASNDAAGNTLPSNDNAGAEEYVDTDAKAMTSYAAMVNDAMVTRAARWICVLPPPRSTATADYRRHCIYYFGTKQRLHHNRFSMSRVYDWHSALESTPGSKELPSSWQDGATDGIHLNYAAMALAANALIAANAHMEADPRGDADVALWISGWDQDPATADAAELATIAAIVGDDATAAATEQPTFILGATGAPNYHHALRFDGVNDFATITEAALTEWTIVFVAKPATTLGGVFGSAGSAAVKAGNGAVQVLSNGDVGIEWSYVEDSLFGVYVIRSDGRCWRNGVELTAIVDEGFAASHALTLTTFGEGDNAFFDGDIADAVLCNTARSIAGINAIGGFFATKYGLSWASVS